MIKQTDLVVIKNNNQDESALQKAGKIIREGGLVAFPTETVYGLGADALNPEAVQKIYTAKGRPSDNPLIVHIADEKNLDALTANVPRLARLLIKEFWPGPLTLVLPKSPLVPESVTGGLSTVAVRMPDHRVALALIQAAGVPIAAPSANLSGKPSPTTAKHVRQDLAGRIEMIIDAGPVGVGVESTVLDVTVTPPLILRPGGITAEQLARVLGEMPNLDPALATQNKGLDTNQEAQYKPRSPGMKYTHYAPEAPLILVEGDQADIVDTIKRLSSEYSNQGRKVGVMATQETAHNYTTGEVLIVGSRINPASVATNLYSTLRQFDELNVQVILAEGLSRTGIGTAVMNRLTKAAGKVICAER